MTEVKKELNPVLQYIFSQKATPEEKITFKALDAFVDDQYIDNFVKFQAAYVEGISRKFPDGTDAEAIAAYKKLWAVAGERVAKKANKE